jgi:uncharacterized protein RhaS with RHS repeats
MNPNFDYDSNGNMTCMYAGGGGDCASPFETVSWYSFNMVNQLTQGSETLSFSYDAEHARIKQVASGPTAGTTYYFNDPVTGLVEEEFIDPSSTVTYRDYIKAGDALVAERSYTNSVGTWNYFVTDHLGSVAVVTNGGGGVVTNGRLSFDPWGMSRNPDGSADTTCS